MRVFTLLPSRTCAMRSSWLCLAIASLTGSNLAPANAQEPMAPAKAAEFLEKSIRPVLAENCFNCHSERKQKAGLRLDSRQAMLTGGDSGPAIVPGHPDQSLLLKALHYRDELKMPPRGQLPGDHTALLTTSIKQGPPSPETAKRHP